MATNSLPISTETVRFGNGFGVVLRTLVIIVAASLSYGGCLARLSGIIGILWFSFFGLVILWCLTIGDTEFHHADRRIQRTWKFLAAIPFWRRNYSLDAFSAVQQRRHSGSEYDTVMIGLTFLEGGFLAVQCFHTLQTDDPCPEADAFQFRLAEISGLPVSHEKLAPPTKECK